MRRDGASGIRRFSVIVLSELERTQLRLFEPEGQVSKLKRKELRAVEKLRSKRTAALRIPGDEIRESGEAEMKRILFIGDSLIEFFDWQARFPGHRVANLGRAGETVEGLLSRIKAITMKHPSPRLVFIMTGINNAAMEDLGFLDSYGKIIDHLKAACPGARIFVHSLLPTLLPWISDASLQEVNRSLARMAEEKGGEFIDLYRLFVDGEGAAVKDYLLADGVHLSDQGYAVWAETLEKIIAL